MYHSMHINFSVWNVVKPGKHPPDKLYTLKHANRRKIISCMSVKNRFIYFLDVKY